MVLLKTIPGIGKILAATIYYEVGHIRLILAPGQAGLEGDIHGEHGLRDS